MYTLLPPTRFNICYRNPTPSTHTHTDGGSWKSGSVFVLAIIPMCWTSGNPKQADTKVLHNCLRVLLRNWTKCRYVPSLGRKANVVKYSLEIGFVAKKKTWCVNCYGDCPVLIEPALLKQNGNCFHSICCKLYNPAMSNQQEGKEKETSASGGPHLFRLQTPCCWKKKWPNPPKVLCCHRSIRFPSSRAALD